MAAKKSLNNPKKPATKTISTRGPAKYGSETTKLTRDNKAGKVTPTNAKGEQKNIADVKTNTTMSKTKANNTLQATKKLVKKGTLVENNVPMPSTMTKKGNKVQANKGARTLNKPYPKDGK